MGGKTGLLMKPRGAAVSRSLLVFSLSYINYAFLTASVRSTEQWDSFVVVILKSDFFLILGHGLI